MPTSARDALDERGATVPGDGGTAAAAALAPDKPVAATYTGTGSDDTLTGTSGDDTINGGAGADTMIGLGGNDTYYVDNAGDKVIEADNGGKDTVRALVSFSLAGQFAERLVLTGTANTNGTGNNLANKIEGNSGNNVIDGGGNADEMRGGAGNDTYIVDNSGDKVFEAQNEGTDTVRTSVNYSIAGQHIENLVLTGTDPIKGFGNTLANVITGNAGANLIDGGAGADTLKGGLGNDIYYVDNAADKVVEADGEGSDTVRASVSFSLAGQSIEALILTGTAAINGTGNSLANAITGNAAANVIDGGGGADEMRGGAGDDTYIVDNAGDKAFESDGQGTDTVRASVTYTLSGQAIEKLILTGSAAINGTGNGLDNILTGNGAANVLNGGTGADTMTGGAGDDTYLVDNAGDVVVEATGQGTDTVRASIGYALGQFVENLVLTGSAAINGNGNALDNSITGNGAANVLNGGAGADAMAGGGGNDTYYVDNVGDTVSEAAGQGTDTVYTLVSYALGANIENLRFVPGEDPGGYITLVGNALGNVIQGNAGLNDLDGRDGSDTLTGGAGLDYFRFSTALGAGNVDTITDFDSNSDQIILMGGAGGVFSGIAVGQLQSNAFELGTVATAAETRILYDSATGALRYDADGVGGAAATLFARLTPGTLLGNLDFGIEGAQNHNPVITSGTSASVAENSAASTIVYQTVASDPDGDALTYRLTGSGDAALLTIDASGAVRLNQSANYEAKNSYIFTVAAKDIYGAETFKTVTLSITDVDEPLGPTPTVNETTGANDQIFQAQSLDRGTFLPSINGNLPDDSLPSVVINGNIPTATDKDFFSVTLKAGEALILDVDNSGGNLDAFLTAYGTNGVEIGSNDDLVVNDPGSDPHPEYGHNTDSFLRFRAPTDGTYIFSISAFDDPDNPTLGSYQLNVSIGPVATAEQIFEEDIEALLSGYSWDHTALSYSFPTSASQYPAGIDETDEAGEFAPFTAFQQNATTQILALYSRVSGLTFTQNSANPASADLRYAMSGEPDTAYAYYPSGTDTDGTAWFNKVDYNDPIFGNYAWTSILHETGHALGLKHGHEAPAVSPGHDSLEYTVMTYRAYPGADVEGGYTNEDFGFPQTLMMLDIAAIQRMYGANFTTNSGNSVYTWNASTGQMSINGVGQATPGANRVFLTVWDGGGTDTYDMSNYAGGVRIDLRPGEWSLTSFAQRANLGDGHFAAGTVANALLFEGDTRSLIENAIGGAGGDDFTANQAANSFTGNGSGDAFYWRAVGDGGVGALADTITDFHSAENDKISFALLDLNPAQAGHEGLTFIGTDAFHNVAGEVRYAVTGGSAHVFVDTDGNGTANMEIILTGVTSLSSSDFVL